MKNHLPKAPLSGELSAKLTRVYLKTPNLTGSEKFLR